MDDTSSESDALARLKQENRELRKLLKEAGVDAAQAISNANDRAEEVEHRLARRTRAFARALRASKTDLQASYADRALYAAIIESATDFVIIATDVEGHITTWNAGATEILQWSAEEMEGRSVAAIFTPEDQHAGVAEAEMRRALEHGRASDQRWHIRKDGSSIFANGVLMPLYSDEEDEENVEPIGFLKIFRDETAEFLIRRELAESRERLDAALRTGLIGFFDWNVATGIILGDAEFGFFFGRTAEDIAAGVPLFDLIDQLPPMQQMHDDQADATPDSADYVGELSVERDGKVRWMLIRARCIERADGRPRRYVGVAIDITERKQVEADRRLLARELQHRVKNVLAVVQSIASQSFREVEPEAAASFSARVTALASAQDVLTETSWQAAPIQDVLERVLAPHGRDRFDLSGPDFELNARQVLSLSLGLHELATNAAKHGALSNRVGRVRIEWTAKNGFFLRWTEIGGPAVLPPTRKGFGSRLLEQSLPWEFGGSAQFDYRPEGLVFTLSPRA